MNLDFSLLELTKALNGAHIDYLAYELGMININAPT